MRDSGLLRGDCICLDVASLSGFITLNAESAVPFKRCDNILLQNKMYLFKALFVAAFLVNAVLAATPLSLPSAGRFGSIVTSNIDKCPCSVYVHRFRSSRSATSDTAFDLLAVRKDELTRISSLARPDTSTINFVARYSSFNNSLSSALHSDAAFYHFQKRQIEEEGEFVVVIRTSAGAPFDPSDYIVRIRPVNHTGKTCPVKLSPDPPATRRYVIHDTSRPEGTPEPRIVGGDFASPNLAPYMVVVYLPGERFCSGALLSSRWAVTAAHCAVNTTFTLGVLTTQAYRDGVSINISRVFQHPKYGGTGLPRQNDIALIELAEPAPASAKFMKLNADAAMPREGEFVRIAGYGTISYLNAFIDEAPRRLRQVDLPITTHSKCLKAYELWEIISKKKQICAGYFDDGGCDAW